MAEHGGVDVALAPNSSVTLEPADSLAFRLQAQAAPQAVLTIRNVSDERKIAFKVKTTRPLRYLVRPNQGLLPPNGAASIMVILQQKDCDELLRLDPSERQLSNDKFLVQSLFVDDSFYELVKTKSAKEMADELTNMWAHTDKKALFNKKLRCRFLQDEAAPSAGASASATTPAPVSPAAPERSPVMLRHQDRQSSQFSSANDLSVHASEANVEPVAPVATPAQLSSALLQEKGDGSPANHKNGDGAKDPIAEVATLRKKYDELVAFTVQLTAQRDVLMTDLDKTRQLLQKATTDAQRARKQADELSATTGLRQRKAGGASSDDGASSPHAAVVTKTSKDQGSFGLLHLVVCAIIFFVVGRYY